MESQFGPEQFDWRGVRPQLRENDALSGQVVTVRSHGGNFSWRGTEYKPDPETKLVANVPVEAVQEIEAVTFWQNGKPFQQRLDVIGRDSESNPE